jgi:RecA-family ATPase
MHVPNLHEPGLTAMREHYSEYQGQGGNGYASGEQEWGTVITDYVYRLANGDPYLKVDRTSAKKFPQYHREGDRWVKGPPAGPKIPYRLPELLAAAPEAPVFVCEGEKDANHVQMLGLVATTNSGGAGKWAPELNPWFAGKRTVYVVEDNDDSGRAHAAEVAGMLRGIVPDVRVISFPELPEKGDVTDWCEARGRELQNGGTSEELRAAVRGELLARARTAKPPPPFAAKIPLIDMSTWDDVPVPEQEWAVEGRIPIEYVTLLSGEGAAGKSLIELQRGVAHVTGRDWYGASLRQGPALIIDAEDADKVIHKRLADILNHYGLTFADVSGQLHVASLAGQDAVLATFGRKSGRIEPTKLYGKLLEMAGDIKPVSISISAAADVFAGNEIDRSQVQQFVAMLTRVAIVARGGLVLVSHPSLTGIATGTGLSGSTQWHNSVRARMVLKPVKPKKEKEGDDEAPDTNLRVLEFHKNNYGPISESIPLRYEDGLFLPVSQSTADQAARDAEAEQVFLAVTAQLIDQGQDLSPNVSRTYAPAMIAAQLGAKAKGFKKRELEAAMRRLLDQDKLHIVEVGSASRRRKHLAVGPRRLL